MSESGRGTDPCVFPHDCRELNDLMDTKSAVTNDMYALKEDMESELTFVRSYSVRAYYGLGHADAWPNRPVYFPLPS